MTRSSTYNITNPKTHVCPACNRRTREPAPKLFALTNACAMLGITYKAAQCAIARQDLDVVKIDGRLFVRSDEVERYRGELL